MDRANWKEDSASAVVMCPSSCRTCRKVLYSSWSEPHSAKRPSAILSRIGKYAVEFSSAAVSLLNVSYSSQQEIGNLRVTNSSSSM